MDGIDPRDTTQLPIVLRWLDFTAWLLPLAAQFPRHYRPTLTHELSQEALKVLMLLTDAAYVREKRGLLLDANRTLNRMRMLFEVSLKVKALAPAAYERATLTVNEVGRMLGGWIKEVAGR